MSTLSNRPHIWFAIHLLSFTVFIERLSLAYASWLHCLLALVLRILSWFMFKYCSLMYE